MLEGILSPEAAELYERLVDGEQLSVKRRSALDPYHRGLWRTTAGTFLLTLCIYAATWFPVFLGQDLAAMAVAFWHAPADHLGVAVYGGIVAIAPDWANGSEMPCATVLNMAGRNSTRGLK